MSSARFRRAILFGPPMKTAAAIALAVGVALVPVTASAHSKPVTGFGATISAWNSVHKAATGHHTGGGKYACYDWVPHAANVLNGSKDGPYCLYDSLDVTAGRVDAYDISLPNHTSLAVAEKFALRQFPNDRKVLWSLGLPDCTIVLVQSNKLAPAIDVHKIGGTDGLAYAEFSTPPGDGSTPVNPADEPLVVMGVGAVAPSDGATTPASIKASHMTYGC